MQLSDYLREQRVTPEDFAESIGVDRSTVYRWIQPVAEGERRIRPRWSEIETIQRVTGGKVTANDFSRAGQNMAA